MTWVLLALLLGGLLWWAERGKALLRLIKEGRAQAHREVPARPVVRLQRQRDRQRPDPWEEANPEL